MKWRMLRSQMNEFLHIPAYIIAYDYSFTVLYLPNSIIPSLPLLSEFHFNGSIQFL